MKHLIVLVALVLSGIASAQQYILPPNANGGVLQPNQVRIDSREVEPYHPTTPFMLSLVDPIQVPMAHWDVTGLRIGLIFSNCNRMTGLDISVFGYAQEARALQIGVVNAVELLKGLQIGVVNYAATGEGVQIGLVNVIADKDFAFMPIINASF